ncbi:MAG: hypothetical protein RSC24_06655 [Clostridium sp.]
MTINKEQIRYNAYFNLPEIVEGIGSIYPIIVPKYKRFSELFSKYMLYSVSGLKNIGKLDKSIDLNLFNFITISCLQTENLELKLQSDIKHSNGEDFESVNEKLYALDMYGFKTKELEELIEMILNKDIVYDDVDNEFMVKGSIYGEKINEENFEIFRDIVMTQNVIYEPFTVKSKLAQKELEKEFKNRQKDSQSTDFLSMIVVVDMNSNGDVNSYSYYKLLACYEIINKKILGDYIQRLMAQGVKEKLVNLGDELNINDNPYSKEKLFKKHTVDTSL